MKIYSVHFQDFEGFDRLSSKVRNIEAVTSDAAVLSSKLLACGLKQAHALINEGSSFIWIQPSFQLGETNAIWSSELSVALCFGTKSKNDT